MTTAWQESWPAPRVSCCSRCASRASSWNRASCEPRVTAARTSSSWSSGDTAPRRRRAQRRADDPARLQADRVWIVDPLDGTGFGEVPGGLGGPRRPVGGGARCPPGRWRDRPCGRPSGRAVGPPSRRGARAPAPGSEPFATAGVRHPPGGAPGRAARALCRHQGLLRHRRRERRLCPRRRAVRVGLGGTGGRGRAAGLHERIDGSPLVYNRPTRSCPTCSSAAPRWPT